MWQHSLQTATDGAVSCTDSKMRRLLPKEGTWQCWNEQTGYQAAREHQRGDRAINLPSLIQSYPGSTWALPEAKQLLGHSLGKHRKKGRHMAPAWLPAELSVSNLFLPALPCAREGLGTRIGRFFIAPAFRPTPAAQGRGTAGSWQPLPLKSFSTWHQGILYTSMVILPIPYERGSWKIAFCLK